MTTLCFVRHGRTIANIQMRIQGQIDNPLSEEGRKDASVDLIKSGMDYSIACMVGAKIKSILENEFDYVVEFINSSNHYDETAFICAQWGYALK